MDGTRTSRTSRLDSIRTASGINILLGIWLIIAPFVLGYSNIERATWNAIIVGVLVLAMAAVRISDPARRPGLSWANMVLGIWLILSPFIMDYSRFAEPLWNDIICGVVIAGMAAWSAAATRDLYPTARGAR
jgi:hypothetical protein